MKTGVLLTIPFLIVLILSAFSSDRLAHSSSDDPYQSSYADVTMSIIDKSQMNVVYSMSHSQNVHQHRAEECHEGFGTNEDGYHSVEDVETGQCYPDDERCPEGTVKTTGKDNCIDENTCEDF